jgi:hypothetical protein
MGERLLKYYKYVTEEKGILGKIKLAKLTSTPSTLAATEEDSPENINKFKKAVEEITGKTAPNF